jgi:hypothetical protein
MPRFELIWGEHASEQHGSLPRAIQRVVTETVADIQADPLGLGSYDESADWYTANFVGEGVSGLIVYVVGEHQRRVVILRVTVMV